MKRVDINRRIAVSDIHGCKNTFINLLKTIEFTRDDTLYVLGDMIDRGPDSKGVVDVLLRMKGAGYDVQVIKGNHEDFMLCSFEDSHSAERDWFTNGGLACMDSYGWKGYDSGQRPKECIPKEHLDFFLSLPTHIELDTAVLVHAGLEFKPNKWDALYYGKEPIAITDPIAQTCDWDKMWSRSLQYDEDLLKGKDLIVGHTPQYRHQIEARITEGNKHIIIDNACVFSPAVPGNLCALDIDTKQLWFEPKAD